ncbi:hypothetical protein HaLaN_20638 [Haematococcus lacustris]|uniref:Uncharacterized protein n=1 Tax=Haematococcus lacustris TaxID=44745 RepID=A0A6A0A1T7_HAELA|nr:hypothetical protein HaLaN_20638 [Haematococcus lacustris]
MTVLPSGKSCARQQAAAARASGPHSTHRHGATCSSWAAPTRLLRPSSPPAHTYTRPDLALALVWPSSKPQPTSRSQLAEYGGTAAPPCQSTAHDATTAHTNILHSTCPRPVTNTPQPVSLPPLRLTNCCCMPASFRQTPRFPPCRVKAGSPTRHVDLGRDLWPRPAGLNSLLLHARKCAATTNYHGLRTEDCGRHGIVKALLRVLKDMKSTRKLPTSELLQTANTLLTSRPDCCVEVMHYNSLSTPVVASADSDPQRACH